MSLCNKIFPITKTKPLGKEEFDAWSTVEKIRIDETQFLLVIRSASSLQGLSSMFDGRTQAIKSVVKV